MKKKIKTEVSSILLVSTVVFLIVIVLSYLAIDKFIVDEEVKRARLVSHTLFYTREYLSKVAPDVEVQDKNIHPFATTPAVSVSQIALLLKENEGFSIRQTSDKYRNPKNKPNDKELKAINFFKKNKSAKELYKIDNNDELVYFYPLKIEQKCLKCHGTKEEVPKHLYDKLIKMYGDKAFGYKVGDIRGVISIDIPLENTRKEIFSIFIKITIAIAIFYLMGMFFFLKIYKNTINDINIINDHFMKYFSKNRFQPLKKTLNYFEFDKMKSILNESVLSVKKSKRESYLKTYYHPITNLPNRKKLLEILSIKNNVSVVLLNIDQFKEINFYFGEDVANKLIKEVVKRINEKKMYQLKIDEFAILKKDMTEDELKKYAKKLIDKLEEVYFIDNNEIYIRLRAGISYNKKDLIYSITALDATRLLGKEIVFCYEAQEIQNKYKNNLIWLNKIKTAIKDDRIIPFFQPILDRDGNIVKYEALVRLIDENGEVISPYFFLDIAKKTRLYFDITKIVVNKSFEKFKNSPYEISINLTTKDISDVNIKNFILDSIAKFPDKNRINIEIVEDENINSSDKAKEFLKTVKKLGCKISIDDFGSGYANFDYLLNLNADVIKIDGSIVKNVLVEKKSEIIIKTIMAFSKEANMKIVCEYVENEEIFNKLKEMGIDYFQGYYFSPPINLLENENDN